MQADHDLPCLCATLRKATRVITRQYDKHLKQSGLRITQYTMLTIVSLKPGITVSELAVTMMLDQTTVTRNLQLLKAHNYILFEEGGDDRRVKLIHITDLGRRKVEQARPLWLEAQREVEKDVGKLGFDVIMQALNTVVTR